MFCQLMDTCFFGLICAPFQLICDCHPVPVSIEEVAVVPPIHRWAQSGANEILNLRNVGIQEEFVLQLAFMGFQYLVRVSFRQDCVARFTWLSHLIKIFVFKVWVV